MAKILPSSQNVLPLSLMWELTLCTTQERASRWTNELALCRAGWWACAQGTPPPISHQLSRPPGLRLPFLKPSSQPLSGHKEGSPSLACAQGGPMPTLSLWLPGLCPSQRPFVLGPSQAGVRAFPCLCPGSVHVLFSPSGRGCQGKRGWG